MLAEQRLWHSICRALELTELVDTDFATRLGMVDAVNGRVRSAVGALDADEAVKRLLAEGAPVSPVTTPEQAAAHEQLVARSAFLETAAGPVPDLPALLTHHPRRSDIRVPAVDEHPEGFATR